MSDKLTMLLKLHDEPFIEQAYLDILERKADAKGKDTLLKKLREGILSKEEIILLLQHSKEGQEKHSITFLGKLRHLKNRLYKVPILGYLYRYIETIISLPQILKKLEMHEISLGKDINQLNKNILKNTMHIKDLVTLIEIKDSSWRHANVKTQTKKQASNKILICCNAYPPNFIGGAELIAHYQALELKEQGYSVTIFSGDMHLNTQHYSLTKELYDGINVYRVKLEPSDFEGDKINFIHTEVEQHFHEILDTLNPSIVHMHNIIGLSVRLGNIAKQQGIQTLLTLHDAWGFCYKNTLMRNDQTVCTKFNDCRVCQPFISSEASQAIPILMRRDYIKLALRDIDAFISPSHYLKDQYIHAGFNKDSITVLDNGIDINKFNIPHIKNDTIRFTFIGYLGEHKGVQVLLEAFNALKNKENISLNIVGVGVLEASLKAYVKRHHLISNVHFLGKVANADIASVFAQTDVYVLPSMWPENQPVTITEAFASKVPVIGTDFGGIQELVIHKNRGLLFPMGDVDALTKAMEYFINNPQDIITFGQNAYTFIKGKTFGSQVAKLIEHYRHTACEKRNEELFVVACVGDAFSKESLDALSNLQEKHSEILFVLHDWLTQSQAYNLIWFTDTSLGLDEIQKYEMYQKPFLLQATDDSLKTYIKENKNGHYYTDVTTAQEAIEYLVKHKEACVTLGKNQIAYRLKHIS